MITEFLPIVVSFFAIFFVYFLIIKIRRSPVAKDKALEITKAIQEGATAYLRRQYRTIGIIVVLLFLALLFFVGWKMAFGFLTGAFLSSLSGFIGVWISTQTNTRVAEGARRGLAYSLDLSFKGGLVTGLLVVSFNLLAVSGFYLVFNDINSLIALGFGTSLISMFARVGGGIYTKAADVGADVVGKVEKGIPEDDPRNPAVIADQVGDNIGECAGMAADIFETYSLTIIASMILASLLFPYSKQFIFLPLFIASISILTSIIASFFVKLGNSNNVMAAIYKGLTASLLLSAICFYPLITTMMQSQAIPAINLYISTIIGLVIAGGMLMITKYYTSKKYNPVKSIVKASQTGHATNIIRGLGVGMQSTALPILLISFGMIISYSLAGIYGVALTAVSMLSISAMVVAINSYGPITDNAAGIARMSNMSKETTSVTEPLAAIGNATKSITKGYSIAAAGLAALVLFSAYGQEVINLSGSVDAGIFALDNSRVIAGLLIGGILPYLFASFLMGSVGKTAGAVVEEVRRQFQNIAGLMEGTTKPDYRKCVDIVAKASIKEMVIPALIPFAAPILVGVFLGVQALGGMLIGAIITGLFIGISMTTSGGAWNNAKKSIEEDKHISKRSAAYQAAITGDAVGDPYKDTAGPAINPMIKVLNVVALLIISFLV